MLAKLRPQDLISILVVCVCGILLGLGRDHLIGLTLLAVVCGYYGIDITPLGDILRRRNTNNASDPPADQRAAGAGNPKNNEER